MTLRRKVVLTSWIVGIFSGAALAIFFLPDIVPIEVSMMAYVIAGALAAACTVYVWFATK